MKKWKISRKVCVCFSQKILTKDQSHDVARTSMHVNFKKFFPKIGRKIYTIHNWVPLNKIKKNISKSIILNKLKIKKKFTFIYTGTLSYKHHFNNIIKLALANQDSQILIFSNNSIWFKYRWKFKILFYIFFNIVKIKFIWFLISKSWFQSINRNIIISSYFFF